MTEKRTLLKAAGLILAISIIGRLLGFVREQVIAANFGTSMATDAYLMAFTIPNLIYVIIGGALATAFIPVFTDTHINQGNQESSRLASYTGNLALVVMSIIALLGILIAPLLVSLIAPGFSPEAHEMTVKLTRIMFPCVLLATLSMLLGGILNSLRHFAMPAFTAAAFSGTVIISVFLLVPDMGVTGLALGTVLGMAIQVLIQIPALFGRGLRYIPRISLDNAGVRRIGELVFPVMIGTGVNQIYVTIDRILASTLSVGSLAALNFANKLMFLPFNLFVVAVNTAVFPSLSALAARNDHEELGNTMVFGLNLIALFTIPAAIVLFALSEPIVRVLFERGAFDAHSTAMTSFALRFFVLGLFAQGAYNVINRTYYALQDTKTPVKISISV
ncbi:MAG: murein biosynthesis integral membrane protein MurJ, partial [Syntrophomonadaceae bacterium]|nr:murein biosynthesis integral membrane protein MurJ [Syntrophomonadaceae bacterium]